MQSLFYYNLSMRSDGEAKTKQSSHTNAILKNDTSTTLARAVLLLHYSKKQFSLVASKCVNVVHMSMSFRRR